MLVGGLMVQLHAMAAGAPPARVTVDLDVLLDVATTSRSLGDAVQTLGRLGFAPVHPNRPGDPGHRFTRGREIVDVLVADHLPPPDRRPRVAGHPAMRIDGGKQALDRRTVIVVEPGGDQGPVRVTVPDRLGALVLKAAAHKADSRERDRHLRDAALLAGLIDDHASQIDRFGGSDRSRLRYLHRQLENEYHEAWLLLDDPWRQRGQDTPRIFADA